MAYNKVFYILYRYAGLFPNRDGRAQDDLFWTVDKPFSCSNLKLNPGFNKQVFDRIIDIFWQNER